MRFWIVILFLIFGFSLSAQVVKTVGVVYTASAPVHTPTGQGAWLAIDTTSGSWYEWERTTGVWRDAGYRIQFTYTTGAPNYTPSKARGRVALNSGDSLYVYQNGAWGLLSGGGGGADNWGTDVVNTDGTLTGNGTVATPLKVDTTIIATIYDITSLSSTDTSGYNLSFTRSSDTIYLRDGNGTLFVVLPAAVVDTDDQGLTIGGSGPTYSIDIDGGSDVTIEAAGIAALSEPSANVLRITATEVDGSITNELQTISTDGNAGNITLSNSGGTLNLNVNDADASTTNEIQNVDTLVLSGTTLGVSLSSDGVAQKTVDLSSLQDGTGTDDQKIDTFVIVSNTLRLSVESDGEAFKSVDLSPYLDDTDTDDQTLTIDSVNVSNGRQFTVTIQDGNSITFIDSIGTAGSGGVSGGVSPYIPRWSGATTIDTTTIYYNSTNGRVDFGTSLTLSRAPVQIETETTTKEALVITGNGSDSGMRLFYDTISILTSPNGFVFDTEEEVGGGAAASTIGIWSITSSGMAYADRSPEHALDLSGFVTDMVPPKGSTANRPAGQTGSMRYNTSNGVFEGRTAAGFKDFAMEGDVTIDTFDITVNTLSLSLLNDGVPAETVDLSPYLDNTDTQDLSIDSVGRSFTISLVEGGSVTFEDTNTEYDLTPYVEYSDSLTIFVTPSQLIDSLAAIPSGPQGPPGTPDSGWSAFNEADVTISSNSETDIVTQAIPAATVINNGTSIDFSVQGVFLNNTGANRTFTPRYKLNGSTIYNDNSGNFGSLATGRAVAIQGKIIRVDSVTARIISQLFVSSGAATTTGAFDFGAQAARVGAPMSVVATVNWDTIVNFAISMELSATVANLTYTHDWYAMQSSAGQVGPQGPPGDTQDLSGYVQFSDSLTTFVTPDMLQDTAIAIRADFPVNTDAQNLTIEGSGPTYTIDISGGSDVTIAAGGIVTLSEGTANVLTVTATEVDGSVTNEIQEFTGSDNGIDFIMDLSGTATDITISEGESITISRTDTKLTLGTTQALNSGTFTPTLFNTTNIDASTASVMGYMRVGNSVTVYGEVLINVTAAGSATVLGMTLPISTDFTSGGDLGGGAHSTSTPTVSAAISGDAANDRAYFTFRSGTDTGDVVYTVHFSYQIK